MTELNNLAPNLGLEQNQDPTLKAGNVGTASEAIERWQHWKETGEWTSTYEIIGQIPNPEVFASDLTEIKPFGPTVDVAKNSDAAAATRDVMDIIDADFAKRAPGLAGNCWSLAEYRHGKVVNSNPTEQPHIDPEQLAWPSFFYLATTGIGSVVSKAPYSRVNLSLTIVLGAKNLETLPPNLIMVADGGLVHASPSLDEVVGIHRALLRKRFALS